MGCCATKDAVITEPEDEGVSPSDSATSPAAVSSKRAKKPKSKNSAWSRNKNNPSAKSGGSPSKPIGNPSAPSAPSGAIPINKGEAPPPGWGRTPEVEEIEVELDGEQSGPRGTRNIPGAKGYISGTRKDQKVSEGVMDRIKGLEDAGLRTKKKMGLKMLTPRIITDVKETWDEEGNLTRYMTHYIEEPDGRKHTKKEELYIAAGDPDPMAQDPAVEAE
jgi:hypothetical protein